MRIISVIVVFICLFPCSVIGQDIDVDKEINIVMDKLLQEIEKAGLAGIRNDVIQDFKTLRLHYLSLDMAKQLNDKKLIRHIRWLIKATESRIKSNVKIIKSIDTELEEIEQRLRELLEQKKKEGKEKQKDHQKWSFSCFK